MDSLTTAFSVVMPEGRQRTATDYEDMLRDIGFVDAGSIRRLAIGA
jgi:hypothetical protein